MSDDLVEGLSALSIASPIEVVEEKAQGLQVDVISHLSDSSSDDASFDILTVAISDASSQPEIAHDHDNKSSDMIMIQCSDEVTILASFKLLAKYSSFFATLESLPRPASSDEAIIPLPSATSSGLVLVIAVLDTAESSKAEATTPTAAAKAEDWRLVHDSDLPHIANAIQIADAYDIPILQEMYFSPIMKRYMSQALLAFAIAALFKVKEKADPLARGIVRSGSRLSQITQNVLKDHSPEYLIALDGLIARYEAAKTQLEYDLKYGEDMTNGFNDYGRRCGGNKRGYASCPAYDRQYDFIKMRIKAADKALFHITSEIYITSRYGRYEVGCQRCTTRISRCFNRAGMRFIERAYRFDV